MSEHEPKPVFRIMYIQGKPTIVERTFVRRSGSWFTTRDSSGMEHKENGNNWSDTVIDAMNREAWCLMNRFAMPMHFKQEVQVRHMQQLLEESFRWGELSGAICGIRREE